MSAILLGCRFFLILALAGSAEATTLTFEDLPNAYFFSSGDQNIGSYYGGLNFGPDVTGLSASRFGGYDSSAFPPHSGDVVIWDATDNTMAVSFSTSEASVGFWYTSLNPITLTVLGNGNNVLGRASGNANTDGTTGTSNFISFSGAGISSVDISSVAGQYVIDDFSFSSSTATPEPNSLLLILSAAVATLWASLRFRRRT